MATAQSKQVRTGKEGAAISQLLQEIRLVLLSEKGRKHILHFCLFDRHRIYAVHTRDDMLHDILN